MQYFGICSWNASRWQLCESYLKNGQKRYYIQFKFETSSLLWPIEFNLIFYIILRGISLVLGAKPHHLQHIWLKLRIRKYKPAHLWNFILWLIQRYIKIFLANISSMYTSILYYRWGWHPGRVLYLCDCSYHGSYYTISMSSIM